MDTVEVSMSDDDDSAGRDIERVVRVWECNLDAIAVFQLCPVSGIGHMGGIYWEGIAPQAITAACWLLRIPRTEQSELAHDVAFMGQCVARERNRQAAAKAKRR